MSAYSFMRLAAFAAAAALWSAAGVAERHALVIGNDSYSSITPLRNARADARAIAAALESAGFQVTLMLDQHRSGMHSALRRFKNRLSGGDEAVFFYAGHGVQIGGGNYLLPVDLKDEDEEQIKDDALHLQRVLDDLTEQKVRFSLAIIDACRDNPFKGRARNLSVRGLAPTTAASGQMVIFSAGAGQQALDRLGDQDKSPNGIFTRVLVKEIRKGGQPIDRALKNVRTEVVRLARSIGHDQVPAIYDQSIGDYYFTPVALDAGSAGASVAAAREPAAPASPDPDAAAWAEAQRKNTRDAYLAYLSTHPAGRFKAAAETEAAKLRPPPAAAPTELIDGRFKIGDGGATITDPRTGLIWQRCLVGQRWVENRCAGTPRSLGQTEAMQLRSTLANYDNWRLPSRSELLGIVACAEGPLKGGHCEQVKGQSAIHPVAFPNTPPARMWTDTTFGQSQSAWAIDFSDGSAQTYRADLGFHARLVRDDAALIAERERDNAAWLAAEKAGDHAAFQGYLQDFPTGVHRAEAEARSARLSALGATAARAGDLIEGRYKIGDDGATVIDVRTGLMWQRCVLGQRWGDGKCQGSPQALGLIEAINRRNTLAGYDNWRMPSRNELQTIVACADGPLKGSRCGKVAGAAAIDPLAFPNTPATRQWTDTTFGQSQSAWAVDFSDGAAQTYRSDLSFGVRLVRDPN